MPAPLEQSSLRPKCFLHQRLQRNESLGHLVNSHVCLVLGGGWVVELVESLRIPRRGEMGGFSMGHDLG